MIMPYIIIVFFFVVAVFSLIEEKVKREQMIILSIFLIILLVIFAGLREVGVDYDSANYESAYKEYETEEGVDYSFRLISYLLNKISNDVHLLFMLYASIGVGLKYLAIRKMSISLFVPIMVYVCYYYEMHECMQIRSGVLGGFYLLSIIYIAEKRKGIALLLLLIGSFFHISGLILLPILFLNNKEFDNKSKTFWCLMIPFSYFIHFIGFNFIVSSNLPYIGSKLEIYQRMHENGYSELGINVFSPLLLMNIMMFYYLMYFSKTLEKSNMYFPLMMKCFSIGISSYMFFSFLPVLSSRINILYDTVSIVLFSNVAYTIKPKYASIALLIAFCFLYLNYGLKCFEGFVFLWEV